MGEVTQHDAGPGAEPDDDSTDAAEHGWEVEYIDKNGHSRTNHPGARHYELVSDRNETVPTLVLTDENDDTIAIYNGMNWVAARRNARAGGGE